MASITSLFGRFGDDFVGGMAAGEKAILGTNEAVQKVDSLGGMAGMAVGKIMGSTKGTAGGLVNDGYSGAKKFLSNDDGSLNKSRLAMTAFGAYAAPALAGRVITGGGLYRDDEGNFDIAGIPFI